MNALQGLSSSVQGAANPLLLQQAVNAFGTSAPFLSDYLTAATLHCDAFKAKFSGNTASQNQKIGVVEAVWMDFAGLFSDPGEMFEPEKPIPPSQGELFSTLFDQGRTGLDEINVSLNHLEDLLSRPALHFPDTLRQKIPEIRKQRFLLDSCPPKEAQGVEAAKSWSESIEIERKRASELIESFHTTAKVAANSGNAKNKEPLSSMVGTAPIPVEKEALAAMFAKDLGPNTKLDTPGFLPFTASLKPLLSQIKDLELQSALSDLEALGKLLENFREQMMRYPIVRFLTSSYEYDVVVKSASAQLRGELASRLDALDANQLSAVFIPLTVEQPILGNINQLQQRVNAGQPLKDIISLMEGQSFFKEATALLRIEKSKKGAAYSVRIYQGKNDVLLKEIPRDRLLKPEFLEDLLKATSAVGEANQLTPLISLLSQNWDDSLNGCSDKTPLLTCLATRLGQTAQQTMATRGKDVAESIAAMSGFVVQKGWTFDDFIKKHFSAAPSVSFFNNPWEVWETYFKDKGDAAADIKLASLVHLSQGPVLAETEPEIFLNLNKAALEILHRQLLDNAVVPKEKFLYAHSLLGEVKARIKEEESAYFRELAEKIPPVSTEPIYGGLGETIALPDRSDAVSDAAPPLAKLKLIEDFTGWSPALSNISRMFDYAAQLTAEYKNENYDGIVFSVKSFFDRFNLAALDEMFWKGLTPEMAEKILFSLETISHFYFKSYFDASVPRLPDAESGLLMMETMALADRLMEKLPASTHLNDQHMPLKEIAPYVFNRGVFYQLGDPKLEKRMKALEQHLANPAFQSLFEGHRDGDSLFETNLSPVKRRLSSFFTGDLVATPKIMMGGFEMSENVFKGAVMLDQLFGKGTLADEIAKNPDIVKQLSQSFILEGRHLKNYLDRFVPSFPTKMPEVSIYKEMLTGSFLPKAFYAARRLAFNAEYFFRGTFVKPSGFKKTEQSYEVSFEGVDAANELSPAVGAIYSFLGLKGWFIYPKVDGIDESVFQDNPQIADGSDKAHQFHHSQRPVVDEVIRQIEGRHLTRIEGGHWDPFENFFQKLLGKFFPSTSKSFRSFYPGITEAGRNIYDLNVVMVQDIDELKKYLTKQEYEELASLRTEPAVQIANTLSFFRKKPNLLQRPDLQTYCLKLLFDAPLLSDELAMKNRGPELERQLAEFVEGEYLLNSKIGNHAASDFALSLASRLGQYSLQARQYHPAVYKNHPAPPFFTSLADGEKSTLKRALVGAPPESLGVIHGLLAQQKLAKATLGAGEAEDFLRHVLFYHSFPPSGVTVDPLLAADLKRLLVRFAPAILKATQTDPAFLDRIAREVYPSLAKSPHVTKSKDNPLVFTAVDGTILDLQQGLVIAPGISGIPLPADALSSPVFAELYDKEFRCKAISLTTFEFTDQHTAVNRLIRQPDGQYVIQRKFPRGWYQYVPRDVVLGKKKEKSELDQLVHAIHSAIPTLEKDKWILPALPLIAGHTHWHGKGEMLILDAKTSQPKYRAEIGSSEILKIEGSHQILRKITTAKGGMAPLELVDLAKEKKTFSWALQFEDPTQTMIWKDPQTKETARIEFPRFALSFVKDGTLFKSEQFAGYHLKRRQINPLGAHLPNFLLLQNKRGEEKLILAAQPLVPFKGSSLSSHLAFERNSEELDEKKSKQSYYTYDKFDGAKRFSNPNDLGANFYLAMIHGAKKRYKDAFALLREFGGSSRPFPQKEKEIFQLISGLDKYVSHNAPPLTALRALAQAALVQNEGGKLGKQVADEYFKTLPKLGLFRLDLDEELALLEISDIDPKDLQILKDLKIKNPDRAKDAIAFLASGKKLDLNQIHQWLRAPVGNGKTAAPNSLLLQPILDDPLDFVTAAKKANGGLAEADLQDLLLGQGTTSLEKKAFDFYYKDALFYLESKDTNHYALKNLALFQEKRITLEKTHYYMREALAGAELAILRLFAKAPNDPEKAARSQPPSDGDASAPIELNELIVLYRKNKLGTLKSRNPELKPEDIANLDRGIDLYLDLAIQNGQRARVIEKMAEVERVSHLKEDDPLLQLALTEFVQAASTKRHYIPTEKNRFLKVFEYHNGYYYLEEQIKNLPGLGVEIEGSLEALVLENLIQEMMVGKGKTTYQLPTFAFWCADGTRLCMAIMPEALLDNMRKGEQILGKSFMQKVKRFQFNINTDLSEENLKGLLKMFEDAIVKREFVMTTDRDIKAFRNQFYRILRLWNQSPTPEREMQAELMRKIFKLFKEKGYVLCDEADMIFNPRSELNFPAGEAQPIGENYLALTLKIYELLTSPEILEIASFDFFPGKAKACTPKVFENKIKPALTAKLLSFLEHGDEFPLLHQFYRHCSAPEKERLKNYFLGNDPTHEAEIWVEKISDAELRDQLGLIRGQLNILLPLTLEKNFGENYGFHTNTSILADPFSGSNAPNLGSQRSDPFERVDETIQAYLKEPAVRRPIVEKLVFDLQGKALKEMKENSEEVKKNPNYKTKAHVEFESYFGERDDLPLFNPDIVDRLMKVLDADPKQKFALLGKYVLTQAKVYPENLKATSQIFGFLYKKTKGFAGALWDSGAFHDNLPPKFEKGARGQIVALAYAQAKDKVTVFPSAKELRDALINGSKYRHIKALIDAGGTLKECDLEETAKKWLESRIMNGSSEECAIVFDKEEDAMIWEKGESTLIPLERSSCPVQKQLTIYDQKHTFGIDIKQAINAIALVTVSKKMIMRDFIQAVGRMRKIAAGQRIEIALLESDALAIREFLGLPPDAHVGEKQVLRYLIQHEARRQGEDNEVATTHKLSGVVEEWLLGKILQLKNIGFINDLVKLVEPLFFQKQTISPFLNYGQGTDLVDAQAAYGDKIDRLIDRLGLTGGLAQYKNELRSLMNQTVSRAELPDKVRKSIFSSGMEQQVEVQQEQQQEQQQDQMMQQEESQAKRLDVHPATHYQWALDAGNVEKSALYEKSSYLSWHGANFINPNQIVSEMPIFDEEFLLSSNFQRSTPTLRAPFSQFQKPLQNIIIVKNRRTKQFKLIALEPFDVAAFKAALQEKQGLARKGKDPDLSKDAYMADYFTHKNWWVNLFSRDHPGFPRAGGDDVQVWIGDLGLNSLYESNPPIPKDELEKNPELARLLVQAKYFDGQVHYNEKEQKILKTWLGSAASTSSFSGKKGKIEEMEKHFKESICAFKEQSKRDYKNSALGKIYQQLRKGKP